MDTPGQREVLLYMYYTGCSLNIVGFFPENFAIILNYAISAAALVFYLPGLCTHTDTEGKQRNARVLNILKSLEKNTILNEHPVIVTVICNRNSNNILILQYLEFLLHITVTIIQ